MAHKATVDGRKDERWQPVAMVSQADKKKKKKKKKGEEEEKTDDTYRGQEEGIMTPSGSNLKSYDIGL